MFIFTLIIFILVIGILVFVHELGHYIAARAVGIKVEEFAIGMGPKVFSKVRNGIEYTLRALPIGGFVRMYGQDDFSTENNYSSSETNSFGGKKPSLRLIVLVAGVFMNFILASLIFYGQGARLDFKFRNIEGIFDESFTPWFGEKSQTYVAIQGLTEDSPLKGKVDNFDIVTTINGQNYTSLDQFFKTISDSKDKEISLGVIPYESNQYREIKVTPVGRPDKPELGFLGFSYGFISLTEFKGANKVLSGFGQALNQVKSLVFSVQQLVKQAMQSNSIVPVADNFGGAIGIFDILGLIITSFGFWGVLELMALFSINLAVFNILPIPALDGGHVLFTLLEIVFRRKLPNIIYNYLTLGGFILLISFMVFVTGLDLVKHTSLRNVVCNEQRQVGFLCDLSDFRQ